MPYSLNAACTVTFQVNVEREGIEGRDKWEGEEEGKGGVFSSAIYGPIDYLIDCFLQLKQVAATRSRQNASRKEDGLVMYMSTRGRTDGQTQGRTVLPRTHNGRMGGRRTCSKRTRKGQTKDNIRIDKRTMKGLIKERWKDKKYQWKDRQQRNRKVDKRTMTGETRE